MIYVDLNNLDKDFTPVDNKETIQILKKYLNFNAIDKLMEKDQKTSEVNRDALNYPLLFGTLSEWKVF
jgi:hypothetical protein